MRLASSFVKMDKDFDLDNIKLEKVDNKLLIE
jgi:hypothetical protein